MWSLLLFAACTTPGPGPSPGDAPSPSPGEVPSPAPSTPTPPTGPLDPQVWVTLPAGAFAMGEADGGPHGHAGPQHEVHIPSFQIMRHEALATDYAACITAGACPELPRPDCLRADDVGRPQNCLTWQAAHTFCAWAGARLPTESEWEYAATSGGKAHIYPWGDEPPDCSRANHAANGRPWCPGSSGAWPVCTHPTGDTEHGLCEMAGNLFEWNADWFDWTYAQHPTDGSAQQQPLTEHRVMRGGGIGSDVPLGNRVRTYHPPDFHYGGMGVRCVRDLPG